LWDRVIGVSHGLLAAKAMSLFKQRRMAAKAAPLSPGSGSGDGEDSCHDGAPPAGAPAPRPDARSAAEESRAHAGADGDGAPPRPLVRVVAAEGGARRMVAARAIPAGTELFCEDPVLLVRTQDRDPAAVCGAAYAEFAARPPAVQAQILAFHTPVDDCDESDMRKLAHADPLAAGDVERYVRVGLIMKANSAVAQLPAEREADTHTLGLGLYELGCRANHSCRPNACWLDAAPPARPEEAAGRRLFRSLCDIAAGEEITNDYLSEGMQARTTCERQKTLMATKNFLCACPRCSATHDDMRAFRCQGHHTTDVPARVHSSSSASSSSSSSSCPTPPLSPATDRAPCEGWHYALNPSPDNLDYLVGDTMCPPTPLSPCCRCSSRVFCASSVSLACEQVSFTSFPLTLGLVSLWTRLFSL